NRYSPTEYPVSKRIPFNRRPAGIYRLAAGLNAFRLATQGGFNSVTHFAHNHVEKNQGVPPTFEPIQVQRSFMSLSFAPSVILPDSTTPVVLDPGALDVIRPCSRS